MKKTLVRVLTVKIDEIGAHFGELSKRCQTAIDVGPRTPLHRNNAAQNDFFVADDETTLYACLITTMTNHRDIAFATHKQMNSFDNHGFTRASFTRKRSEPVFKDKSDRVDNA